jgi:hypothetical protein
METLKKIVSNQYFPAAAVLTAVVLFWAVGMLGGLSMLNDKNPPMATLTWMLFVYMAAVLTPVAGIMAAMDLIRRYRLNRRTRWTQSAQLEQADVVQVADEPIEDQPAEAELAATKLEETEPALTGPAEVQQPAAQQPKIQQPATQHHQTPSAHKRPGWKQAA